MRCTSGVLPIPCSTTESNKRSKRSELSPKFGIHPANIESDCRHKLPSAVIPAGTNPALGRWSSAREEQLSVEQIYALPRLRSAPSFRLAVGGDVAVGVALLGVALIVGLVTAQHYGFTVDEFNTDDYGPKALAWYTSLGADRSHFETVEEYLWYYGPWHQILIAIIQSSRLADPITVRHAMTFLVGLG